MGLKPEIARLIKINTEIVESVRRGTSDESPNPERQELLKKLSSEEIERHQYGILSPDKPTQAPEGWDPSQEEA